MAMREIDPLSAAIAATEGEIFGEAFGKEETVLDETGDRSIEELGEGLEGQHELEEGEEGEEGEGNGDEGSPEGKEPDKAPVEGAKPGDEKPAAETPPVIAEGRIPPGRLRQEAERARLAEAERDTLKAQVETERTNSRKEVEALNAKFDGLLAAIRNQPQGLQPKVETKPEGPPDIFEDPKGFADYIRNGQQGELQKLQDALQEQRVETSLQIAHTKHGEAFANAFETVKRLDANNPESRAIVQRIYASPNPGEALVQWHKRGEVLRQVGDDPAKYRESIAEETRKALMADPEFRRQLIEELRGEADQDQEKADDGQKQDGRATGTARVGIIGCTAAG